MQENIEQGYAIKFCVKLNESPTRAFASLAEAYGDATLSRTMVFKWQKAFKEGWENVEDDPRSGRPIKNQYSYFWDKPRTWNYTASLRWGRGRQTFWLVALLSTAKWQPEISQVHVPFPCRNLDPPSQQQSEFHDDDRLQAWNKNIAKITQRHNCKPPDWPLQTFVHFLDMIALRNTYIT